MEMLTDRQVLDAGLPGWRKLAQPLYTRYRTGDPAAGLRLVTAVTEAAGAASGQLRVTLTDAYVDVEVVGRDTDTGRATGVTAGVVELARRVTDVARSQGIEADTATVAQFELALDTADPDTVGPFWSAVLTGGTAAYRDGDVRDPTGQVPNLWFQRTDAHALPRQRFHVDLWVAHDVAEQRIAAAVAAGGRVVDDTEAPSFVVLADPEGNKVCVCTCLDR